MVKLSLKVFFLSSALMFANSAFAKEDCSRRDQAEGEWHAAEEAEYEYFYFTMNNLTNVLYNNFYAFTNSGGCNDQCKIDAYDDLKLQLDLIDQEYIRLRDETWEKHGIWTLTQCDTVPDDPPEPS